MDVEYAKKGVAGTGLGLGIAGTALGLLNNGSLGGLLGGNCNMGYMGCQQDHIVSRYEAGQAARIAELETEVKLRDANFYTLSEMGKLRDYVDGRINGIEQEICQQRVYNATNTSAMTCMQGQIAQLYSLTKLVVPNGSICPGWGDVTVSITPAPTTGA
jgi:hypothetical protein